jgi:fatty acid desaturase
MSTVSVHRDYGLLGPESEKAAAAGLVSAKWYAPNISRVELKELMKREDAPAIRDTLIWIAALIISGGLGWWFWGSWTAVPFFIIYGVLYGSASDSRWHECGHRTAFKTVWMNDAVYELACFMILREPEIWRWSHTRHHTDTIIVGRDPEIITPRPPDVVSLILNIFALKNAALFLRSLFIHARGRMTEEEKTFVPESERPKVYRTARIYFGVYALVIVACVWSRSILPAMYVGLPSLYGSWLQLYFGCTQHLGLAEDVLDHRLNSRTIYMNPVFRFLYWNMNYHVEHHIFPLIPYHAAEAAREDQIAVPNALSQHNRRLSGDSADSRAAASGSNIFRKTGASAKCNAVAARSPFARYGEGLVPFGESRSERDLDRRRAGG